MGYKRDIGPLYLAANMGAMVEENALLGSRSYGAIKLASKATSLMLNVQSHAEFGNGLSLGLNMTAMETHAKGASGGLVQNIGRLRSTTWSASLTKDGLFDVDDTMGFSVSQPLRVESGHVDLRNAVDRDYATDTLIFADQKANLSPSGRQLNLEASYARPLDKNWLMEANLVHQMNPAHSLYLKNNTAFLINVSKRFGGR